MLKRYSIGLCNWWNALWQDNHNISWHGNIELVINHKMAFYNVKEDFDTWNAHKYQHRLSIFISFHSLILHQSVMRCVHIRKYTKRHQHPFHMMNRKTNWLCFCPYGTAHALLLKLIVIVTQITTNYWDLHCYRRRMKKYKI